MYGEALYALRCRFGKRCRPLEEARRLICGPSRWHHLRLRAILRRGEPSQTGLRIMGRSAARQQDRQLLRRRCGSAPPPCRIAFRATSSHTPILETLATSTGNRSVHALRAAARAVRHWVPAWIGDWRAGIDNAQRRWTDSISTRREIDIIGFLQRASYRNALPFPDAACRRSASARDSQYRRQGRWALSGRSGSRRLPDHRTRRAAPW
jgi:hypothetical protein